MTGNQKTKLRISTPNGIFFEDDVYMVTLKTSEGYIGLQYNRMPFISSIEISTLYINIDNNSSLEKQKKAAIGGGIVFSEKTYIDIFTDDIEWVDEIVRSDVERQIENATQKLQDQNIDLVQKHKNELILKKAINKLTTLNK